MKRIIMEVDPKSLEHIDKLKRGLGLKTRTGVLRHALALLDATVDHMSKGYELQFKKGDEIAKIIIPVITR